MRNRSSTFSLRLEANFSRYVTMTLPSLSRINPMNQSLPLQLLKVRPLTSLLRPSPMLPPRTRSAVIQHALRWVISTGTLATSPNGAVEFNQFIDALGALEEVTPNPWRDFEIANADPSLKFETTGEKRGCRTLTSLRYIWSPKNGSGYLPTQSSKIPFHRSP